MSRATLLPLLPLLALLVAAPSARSEDFIPSRLRFLDSVTATGGNATNLLFRGNAPILDGAFAWGPLVETMKNASEGAGVPFPSDFYMIDVSFLVGLLPKEAPMLKAEEAFFKANATLGRLVNWPLVGNLINPNSFGTSLRKSMAGSLDKWTIDKMPEKLPALRAMFTGAMDKPVVVYIHCSAGVDRTGEMSGSWSMEFQNRTYAEVTKVNTGIEPRPIAKASEHGLMWYCLYLNWSKGYGNALGCPSQ